ncbi:hypothetical protein SAMN05216597_0056 [Pseudomonas cannabina]|nr:hypothetical protein SAMN05216597_0056 [Pseudomonas cannabina]
MRYLEIYRDQGRSRCDRIVPGPLVAEILRYIENSLAGRSQYDLEQMLLGTNQLGAQWRAYVAHPRRDAEERKAWRTWYGRYGFKNSISEQRAADPFAIQPPPLPQLDEGESEIPRETLIYSKAQLLPPDKSRPPERCRDEKSNKSAAP